MNVYFRPNILRATFSTKLRKMGKELRVCRQKEYPSTLYKLIKAIMLYHSLVRHYSMLLAQICLLRF